LPMSNQKKKAVRRSQDCADSYGLMQHERNL